MTKQEPIFRTSETHGYLNVCLSHEDVTQLPDGRVPLRNLVKALEEYLGHYGGQSNIRIAIYYRDADGTHKPLLPDIQE
jgi:hypothetical protein